MVKADWLDKVEKELETAKKEGLISESVIALVSELRIHQSELETQNEELIQSQEELSDLYHKYHELFDDAPVGYFTLDEHGIINDVNIKGAELLQLKKNQIIERGIGHLIPKNYQNLYYTALSAAVDSKQNQKLEIELKKGKKLFNAQMEIMPLFNRDDEKYRIIATDITERKNSEKALKESEDKYRSFFESSLDATLLTIPDGHILDANPAAEKLFGYSKDEICDLGRAGIVDPDDSRLINLVEERKHKGRARGKLNFIRKDGTKFIGEISSVTFKDRNGNERSNMEIRDISKREKAEKALKESEERFRTVADFTYDWEYWVDPEGNFIYVSPSCERVTGYTPEEFMEDPFLLEKITNPQDSEQFLNHIHKEMLSENPSDDIRFSITTKNGELKWIRHGCQPLYNDKGEFLGRRAGNRDSTKLKLAEDKILASLKEKETLLQEIHHRVKNNMQIIASLLRLQEASLEDEDMLNVLKEIEGRVRSMAMVHENLYGSTSLSDINFKEYTTGLISDIFYSNGIKIDDINTRLELEDINLNIETAIPLGLIINEIVTNSIKYAFPQGKGEIKVTLSKYNDKCMLIISDNGIGVPENLDIEKTDTLGLKLVNRLTNQIDGQIKLDRTHGTKYQITFKEIDYHQRI